MAEEQDRPRKDSVWKSPSWKIFTAFKVALDPKKLLLAGMGILLTAVGWFVWSWLFYNLTSMPVADNYLQTNNADNEKENELAFRRFKVDRERWNFLHQVAGPRSHVLPDLGDIAQNYQEYAAAKKFTDYHGRLKAKVEVVEKKDKDKTPQLVLGENRFLLAEVDPKFPVWDRIKDKPVTLRELLLDPARKTVIIGGKYEMKVSEPERFTALKEIRDEAKDLVQIQAQIDEEIVPNPNLPSQPTAARVFQLVSDVARMQTNIHSKPSAEFRTFPWFEYRGPNPYLTVARIIEQSGKEPKVVEPTTTTGLAVHATKAQIAYLFEPLVKFLKPIVYFFDTRAGGFINRMYLIFIILTTILVWSIFGGAITRIAAVQVARNDKVGLLDALQFAQSRLQSYFAAPVLPLLFLGLLSLFLWVCGLFFVYTFAVGDVVGGLFWPVTFVVGLIMAVVLAGLVGWPLMNATISSEGSDSFDALSRSYSYVYQAPWSYLWFSFLALVYGAVLVFFVGFMGSLLVYLGKWGVSQTPYIDQRDPAFLFVHTPTSFGWRDLLLHDSPHAERVVSLNSLDEHYQLNEEFRKTINIPNRIGIYLVTFWVSLLFLLIVGFGYSYFWSATTIIYLLMRQKVDDTELDEIHLEEEERDQPFMPERTTAPKPAANTNPPGVTFTMVDPPQLRPSTPPPSPPPVTAPPATPVAEVNPGVAAPSVPAPSVVTPDHTPGEPPSGNSTPPDNP